MSDDLVPEKEATLARAAELAKSGRPLEGMALVLGAMAARPEADDTPWLTAALAADLPSELPSELPPELAPAVLAFLQKSESDDRRRLVLALLEKLAARSPSSAALQTLCSTAFRSLSRFPEAIAAAERAVALEPSVKSFVSLEGALKAAGQLERATETCRQAIACSTDDTTTKALHLDLGDLLLERGLWEESLAAYRKVLAQEPKHPWAFPSACYLRIALDDDDAFLEKLADFAESRSGSARARVLLQRILSERRDWETHLPHRRDVLVDALASKLEELEKKKSKKLAFALQSSYPSAPSIRLVPPLLEGRFEKVRIDFLAPEEVGEPDPRRPRGDVPIALWKYEGDEPVRAVSAPEPAVALGVAKIAAERFVLDAWWASAGALAREVGPARLTSLLGAMVTPGPAPPKIQPWNWIFRLQVAAAFAIAQLDGGWEDSLRRRALVSLALGPLDWSGEAALVALTEIARRETDVKAGVLEVLEQLLDDGQPEGEPLAFLTLLICLKRIPDLPTELAMSAREALVGLLQGGE